MYLFIYTYMVYYLLHYFTIVVVQAYYLISIPIKCYLMNIVITLIVTIGYPSAFSSSKDMDLINFKNSF